MLAARSRAESDIERRQSLGGGIPCSAADELTAAGGATYAWDANGSELTQTTGGVTTTFSNDPLNRLSGISGPTTATYALNGDGLRVAKAVNGTTTSYTWDPTGIGRVLGDGNEYLWGAGLIGQVASGGSVTYAHADGLGSVRLLTDASGNVAGREQYDAYAAPAVGSGKLRSRRVLDEVGRCRLPRRPADLRASPDSFVLYAAPRRPYSPNLSGRPSRRAGEGELAMATREIARPAEIVLVRSGDCMGAQMVPGEAAGDTSMRRQRIHEFELTDHGVAQARLAGKHLAEKHGPFDAIFVSPWRRATHTLELILDAYAPEERARVEHETRPDERLRDRDPGIIAFMDRDTIAKLHPEEFRRLDVEGPYFYRPSGGESWADVTLRCYSIVNTIFRDRPDQKILVVTHGLVIMSVRKILERLSHEMIIQMTEYDLPLTCSVSRFEPLPGHAEGGRMRLVEWNTVPYTAEYDSASVGLEQYVTAFRDWRLNMM